jgi:hypothetical protein
VRATRVSRRFACGFRTDLHFADVFLPYLLTIQEIDSYEHIVLTCRSPVHNLHNI